MCIYFDRYCENIWHDIQFSENQYYAQNVKSITKNPNNENANDKIGNFSFAPRSVKNIQPIWIETVLHKYHASRLSLNQEHKGKKQSEHHEHHFNLDATILLNF